MADDDRNGIAPDTKCPVCDGEIWGAHDPNNLEAKPEVGTFCVCVYCAAVLRLDREGHLRIAKCYEIDALPRDHALKLETIRAAVVRFMNQS